MSVETFVQPDVTTQSASVYKAAIDATAAVFNRIGGAFAPHQVASGSPAPDMALAVDAGVVFDAISLTLTEVAAQTVTGFTTPSAGTHRVDRVVIDEETGTATRVAGTAVTGSPSATAPAIPSGKRPCCQILFTDSSTVITNSMITDERVGIPVRAQPGWNLIETKTADGSSGVLRFADLNRDTYDSYAIYLDQIKIDTDDQTLGFRVAPVASPTQLALTGYSWASRAQGVGGGDNHGSGADGVTTAVLLTRFGAGVQLGSAAGEHFSGVLEFSNPEASDFPAFSFRSRYANAGGAPVSMGGAGKYDVAGAISDIALFVASGNILSGSARLYGLRKS